MNQQGFTVVELMVALAIVALVLGGTYAVQQQTQVAYLVSAARAEVQQSARFALEVMTSQLRSAQSITTATNCNNASAGTDDITFVDQDGTTIRFRRSGTALQRNGETIVEGVESLAIRCYASDGTTLTAVPYEVRTIRIRFVAQTSGTAGQHAVVESTVRLRNTL